MEVEIPAKEQFDTARRLGMQPLRLIDTEGLVSFKDDATGPWRLGDGTLLRTHHAYLPITELATAQAVFDGYRAAYEAGAGTPQPYEIVRTPNGFGLVVAYVDGLGISAFVELGVLAPQAAGTMMGALVRRLHTAHAETGRDWGAQYRTWAHAVSRKLPGELGERLVRMVEAVPQTGNLLHGDLHQGNFLMSSGAPALIDLENAGFGNPLFDLAGFRSRLLYFGGTAAQRKGVDEATRAATAQALWQGVLEGYFEGVAPEERTRTGRCVEALCELEYCCHGLPLAAAKVRDLSAAEQERFALAQAHIDRSLPQLDEPAF